MKKTAPLFLLFVLCNFEAYAQHLFTASYSFPKGGLINHVEELTDSSLILSGVKPSGYVSPNYVSHASILKTNKNGGLIWFKGYVPSPFYFQNFLNYTKQFKSDSVFFSGSLTYKDSNGYSKLLPYIGKMDTAGNISKVKSINLSTSDLISSIFQTKDSGYIIAGNIFRDYESFGSGPTTKIFLMKLDKSLNQQWCKLYGDSAPCYGAKFLDLPDGGFAISAFTTQFSDTFTQWFLMRTDSTGNVIWAKRQSGITEQAGGNQEMVLTKDSCIAIAYQADSPLLPSQDVSFAKVDLNGNLIFHKVQGDQYYDEVKGLICTQENGFIIFSGTLFRILDSLGNVLSATFQNPGLPVIFNDIKKSKDGSFVIAGIANPTYSQMIVAKNDSNCLSSCTNINFTNLFSIPSGLTLTNWTIKDTVAVFLESNLMITSYDSIPTLQYLCATEVDKIKDDETVNVFPNPVQEIMHIESTEMLNHLKVYSMQGQLLNDNFLSTKVFSINLKEYVRGAYIFMFYSKSGIIVKKIIKI